METSSFLTAPRYVLPPIRLFSLVVSCVVGLFRNGRPSLATAAGSRTPMVLAGGAFVFRKA